MALEPLNLQVKREQETAPIPTVPQFITPKFDYFPYPHDYLKPHFRSAQFNENGNSIHMTMLIQAKYLHDALYFILGHAKAVELTSGSPTSTYSIQRRLPMRIPMDATYHSPTWGMVAKNVTGIRLIGDTGKAGVNAPAGYENFTTNAKFHQTVPATTPATGLIDANDPISRNWMAEIDIEFWHPPYVIETDDITETNPLGERSRFTLCTFSGGMEYASMNTGVIVWGPDAPANDQSKDAREACGGGGRIVPTGTLVVTWFKVPRQVLVDLIPLWQIAASNPVNIDPMTFNVYDTPMDFGAETLLFIPPQNPPEPKFFPTGDLFYDIQYTFMWRASGWNSFLHPNGNYYSVELKNGDKLYEVSDFEHLFNPYI